MSAFRAPFLLFAGTALWAQSPAGDPTRGKALFEYKGDCLRCHRVNGTGGRIGPDLSDIGLARRAGGPSPPIESMVAGNGPAMERKILDPEAEVAPANRFVRVVTKDGATLTGRLLNHDNFSVQLLEVSREAPEGKLRAFMKSDLREFAVLTKSQMPSYKGILDTPEVADVVAYLLTLKGLGGQ
ncbi:MAG TPA: c-type cytochrome [Bryobacteraceae bacterium]|nr:c-type cytochrome [Bryobacteraceae bacterium]